MIPRKCKTRNIKSDDEYMFMTEEVEEDNSHKWLLNLE